jgi:hypothetical protein
MITALFKGWTDSETGAWFPIHKMTWNENKSQYHTVYLHGMLAAMKISAAHRTMVRTGLAKLDRIVTSDRISVHFKSQLPLSRQFTDTTRLRRLGLSPDLQQFDPFTYVARSGARTIDNFDLFAALAPDELGYYHFHFGSRDIEGIEITDKIQRLQIGTKLKIEDNHIFDNKLLLGGLPGYIADIARNHPEAIDLMVERVNHDEYRFGKILCHAVVDSRIYVPFTDKNYQPLVETLAASR